MKDDPTIARIRTARHNVSEAHKHDPVELIRYYMQLQKQREDRLLPASPAVSERKLKREE